MIPLLPIVSALTSVVPSIANWIGGDKAEDAASKISEIAKTVTGLSNPNDAKDMILNDPEAKLKFMSAVEDNRFELDRIYLADRSNAREMYGEHNKQADLIANKITIWNIPYVITMVIVNCLVVYFLKEDVALVAIASNVIGMVIKSLLDQMQSVTGFYFGSSMGSKSKD